jgi:subtilisin family serine protease
MRTFIKEEKLISRLIIKGIKKITLIILIVSIGLFQSIEFKLDVQATSSSAFLTDLDQVRENRLSEVKNASKGLQSSVQQRTQGISTNDFHQYFVKFKDSVLMDEISNVLNEYNFNILGSLENKIFAVSTDNINLLEAKLSNLVDYIEYEADLKIAVDTNDTYYAYQWGHAATRIEPVWSFTKGAPDVYICIIDTGLIRSHSDLQSDMFRAGIDYYNNGEVLTDTDGHGTFIAGIIGADTNNAKGIAGIAYNSYIVPFRIPQDSEGYFDTSKIIEAIYDAADVGCDVINMSLGGPGSNSTFNTAVQYAINKGSIVIAAAGNDGDEGNEISYPASYNNVVSVASINSSKVRSYFSTYNQFVDVSAPGENIYSTSLSGGYNYGSGTSFAAPYVSAIAGLIKSLKADLTPAKFNDLIKTTSTDLGASGFDNYYGYGLINAEAMVNNLYKPAPVTGLSASYSTYPNRVILTWNTSANATEYHIYRSIGNDQNFVKFNPFATMSKYEDLEMPYNSTVFYKVVGIRNLNEGVLMGDFSSVVSISTPTIAPVIRLTGTDLSTYSLSWDAVPGTTSYDIYQNNVLITSLSSSILTYKLVNLVSEKRYDYQIVSKKNNLVSDKSNTVSITPSINAPSNFKILDTHYNGFTFSWDPIDLENEYKYEILVSTTSTGNPISTINTNETQIRVSNLNFNQTYFFKIRAYDSSNTLSNTSSSISGKTILPTLTDLSVSSPNASTAELSWSAVEGAAGYEISFSKGTSTTYTVLRSVTTLTTNHTALTANTVFNYKVRAYRMAGTTKVYSGYSDVKSITTPPTAPVIKAVSKSIDTITVTWTKVVNATGYVLYVNESEYTTIEDGNIISYDVSGLNLGESYKFKLVD